jgi:hypothetical protein
MQPNHFYLSLRSVGGRLLGVSSRIIGLDSSGRKAFRRCYLDIASEDGAKCLDWATALFCGVGWDLVAWSSADSQAKLKPFSSSRVFWVMPSLEAIPIRQVIEASMVDRGRWREWIFSLNGHQAPEEFEIVLTKVLDSNERNRSAENRLEQPQPEIVTRLEDELKLAFEQHGAKILDCSLMALHAKLREGTAAEDAFWGVVFALTILRLSLSGKVNGMNEGYDLLFRLAISFGNGPIMWRSTEIILRSISASQGASLGYAALDFMGAAPMELAQFGIDLSVEATTRVKAFGELALEVATQWQFSKSTTTHFESITRS